MNGPLDNIRMTLVDSWDEAVRFKQWLGERRGFLSVDTETEGLNVGVDRVRLVQFGDAQQGFAFEYPEWHGVVKEAIETYRGPIAAHNLLFDSKMLKKHDVLIPQREAHDTMVMCFLDNPAARMDLKGASTKYVDPRSRAGQGALKTAMAANDWTWATVPRRLPAYWQYGVLDTCLCAMLADKLYPEIIASYRRAYELELGVIHCIRGAELAGMLIDEPYRVAARDRLRSDLGALTTQVPLNANSDAQVITYLHSLGAVWNVFTEKGNLSVDKSVLAMLAKIGYPQAAVIAEIRSKTNLLNNYIEKCANIGDSDNGLAVDHVVYANTRPLAARTGRMSVTDPPLQTLPRGRVVRDAFIAREGCAFVQADFAGMELRALASFAREPEMLAAFDRGEDLHNFVASKLYGASYTKPQRSVCKNAAFATIYGAGVEQFAATAEIAVDTAKDFLDSYHAMFPGIAQFMGAVTNAVIRRAGGKKKGMGFVKLIDGRVLPCEADEAYKGLNYLIQGSCAVSAKERIVELDNAGLGEFFRLAVHDELLFEAPAEIAEEVRETVKRVMPDRWNFPGVTLEVDTDVIDRWGQHYSNDYDAYIETALAPWLATEENSYHGPEALRPA